jgi:hypothetical protein
MLCHPLVQATGALIHWCPAVAGWPVWWVRAAQTCFKSATSASASTQCCGAAAALQLKLRFTPLRLLLSCLFLQAGLRGVYVQRNPHEAWPEYLPAPDAVVQDFGGLLELLGLAGPAAAAKAADSGSPTKAGASNA